MRVECELSANSTRQVPTSGEPLPGRTPRHHWICPSTCRNLSTPRHAWRACGPQEGLVGSNPTSSVAPATLDGVAGVALSETESRALSTSLSARSSFLLESRALAERISQPSRVRADVAPQEGLRGLPTSQSLNRRQSVVLEYLAGEVPAGVVPRPLLNVAKTRLLLPLDEPVVQGVS